MSNKIYFTPGPSQVYHTFESHLKDAIRDDILSISHRSNQFIKIMEETTAHLRNVLNLPQGYKIYYINSANEAWDRILQNLVLESSHHFVNGSFSKKFYDFALQHNLKSTVTKAEDGRTFESLEVPDTAELIGITKNETSVGYTFIEEEIKQIRSENPNKLIALDVVSAAPAIKIDFSQVDTAYFSVQKAFGMPAGLGIWIANEKCLEKAREVQKHRSLGSYRSLLSLDKFGQKNQTPETPNMLYIYLIGKIALDMLNYGTGRIINDTIYKAVTLKKLNDHPLLNNFVKSKDHQSLTTLVFDSPEAESIIQKIREKKLVLGTGYGSYKNKHVRIANFPALSKEVVESLTDMLFKI